MNQRLTSNALTLSEAVKTGTCKAHGELFVGVGDQESGVLSVKSLDIVKAALGKDPSRIILGAHLNDGV